MTNLQKRQEKIQAKRKKTPWREFLQTFCAYRPFSFVKYREMVTQYPEKINFFDVIRTSEYNTISNETFIQTDHYNKEL